MSEKPDASPSTGPATSRSGRDSAAPLSLSSEDPNQKDAASVSRAITEEATLPSRVLGRVALLALAARIGLWVVSTLSTGDISLEQWVGWDAHNYLRIADIGYPASGHDALFIVHF